MFHFNTYDYFRGSFLWALLRIMQHCVGHQTAAPVTELHQTACNCQLLAAAAYCPQWKRNLKWTVTLSCILQTASSVCASLSAAPICIGTYNLANLQVCNLQDYSNHATDLLSKWCWPEFSRFCYIVNRSL